MLTGIWSPASVIEIWKQQPQKIAAQVVIYEPIRRHYIHILGTTTASLIIIDNRGIALKTRMLHSLLAYREFYRHWVYFRYLGFFFNPSKATFCA